MYKYALHIIKVDVFKQEGDVSKIKTDNSESNNWIIQKSKQNI